MFAMMTNFLSSGSIQAVHLVVTLQSVSNLITDFVKHVLGRQSSDSDEAQPALYSIHSLMAMNRGTGRPSAKQNMFVLCVKGTCPNDVI